MAAAMAVSYTPEIALAAQGDEAIAVTAETVTEEPDQVPDDTSVDTAPAQEQTVDIEQEVETPDAGQNDVAVGETVSRRAGRKVKENRRESLWLR